MSESKYKVGDRVRIEGESGFCDLCEDDVTDVVTRYHEKTGAPYEVVICGDDEYRADTGQCLKGALAYAITGKVEKKADPMAKFLNENPWEHRCSNGTRFTHERCDFRGGPVRYSNEPQEGICETDERLLMADVAEMIGYHAGAVHPRLNGFSGYDCVTFERVEDEVAKREVVEE